MLVQQLRLIIVVLLLLFVGCYYVVNELNETRQSSNHSDKNNERLDHQQQQQAIKKNDYIDAVKLLRLHETSTFKGIQSSLLVEHVLPPSNIISIVSNNNDTTDIDHYNNHHSSRSLLSCVYNETQLRNAISNVPYYFPDPIDICSSNITIDGRNSSFGSLDGILLQGNNFQFVCNLGMTGGSKCIFDAQGLSRHFTIINATVSFTDIILMNGIEGSLSPSPMNDDWGYRSPSPSPSPSPYPSPSPPSRSPSSNGTGIIMRSTSPSPNPSSNGSPIMVGSLWPSPSPRPSTPPIRVDDSYDDSGGAIMMQNSMLSMTRCVVTNNVGNIGGGIYASNSTMKLTNCTIYDNFAQSGGAISIHHNSIVQMIQCDMFQNTANDRGGVVHAMNSILEIITSNFSDNVASYEGGVIHASDTTINFTTCNINNNTAYNGGVIYSEYCQIVFTDGNITTNYANFDGGVVYADYSSITFMASTMQGNGCQKSGGIIRPYDSNIVMIDCIMQHNYASWGGVMSTFESTNVTIIRCAMITNKVSGSPWDDSAGGAMYVAYDSTLQMTDCYIYGNTAQFSGAFLGTANTQIILMRCILVANHAEYNAGAIYIDTYSNMEMIDCNVSYNTATNCGGGMMVRNSSISLTNVVFNNNMAEQGTVRTHDSTFTLKNVSFLSSNPDMAPCNLFVSNSFLQHDIPGAGFDPSYRESCINLPTSTSINRRRLQTQPTIEDHNQKDMTVVDLDNDMYPEDQIALKNNTTSKTQLSLQHGSTRQRKTTINQKCIKYLQTIGLLVASAKPVTSLTPTQITVCNRVYGSASQRRRVLETLDGIDISHKNIVFVCSPKKRSKKRCTIDAGGMMRHFYGSNTKVKFHNIRFMNGYHDGSGGALLINHSDVTLTMCSFVNNTAMSGGGAVLVNQTRLIVNGMETSISQTGGNGSPIEIHSSNATVHHVTITNNNASQNGDSVLLFDSKVNVTNVTFGKTIDDCNLIVSVDPLNPTRDKTCVSLS